MTQFSIADIKDVLPQVYGSKFTRVINASVPFVKAVKHVNGYGHNWAWQGSIDDGSDLSFYADGADAPTETQTPVVGPVLSWGLNLASIELSTSAIEDASEYSDAIQSREIAKILDLQFDAKIAKGVRTMGKSFYTGRGVRSGQPDEPVNVFDALAGSYAGVTNEKWVGQVDTTHEALSLVKLRELERLIYTNGSGEVPNFVVCDSRTFNKYRDLFTQYTHVMPQAGAAAYNWAPTNLFFESMQVIRDRNLDSLVTGDGYGRLLMLNVNDIELVYKSRKADIMAVHAVKEGMEMTGTREERIGVPLYIEDLAKKGYAERFMVSCKYLWRIGNPSLHGCMTKINLGS